MPGSFIDLTEAETGRLFLVKTDRLTCVAPHRRSGDLINLLGIPDRMDVDERPAQIAEVLQAAEPMPEQHGRARRPMSQE
jgi:hypothetical protein